MLDFVGPIQRLEPKPLWYVLGTTEFFGESIKVDSRVLIPRSETEILTEWAVEQVNRCMECSKTGLVSVLDLCTGSGCIAKAVEKNTNADVVAVDFCDSALSLAKENLEGTSVEVLKGDMFENLKGRHFDIIVCNPPYIKTGDIAKLDIEVRGSEPHLALDGGVDGLNFYRRLAAEAAGYLKAKGTLLLEVGIGQASKVRELLEEGGFDEVLIIKDLEGVERVVKARLK